MNQTGNVKSDNEIDKNFMVNCVITAGEDDPNRYGKWLDNDLRHFEIVKHNVPYSEFLEWMNSVERWNRVRELEKIAEEKLGKDYWTKYNVCCFCTIASKD